MQTTYDTTVDILKVETNHSICSLSNDIHNVMFYKSYVNNILSNYINRWETTFWKWDTFVVFGNNE
jgi:hypothetical protein